MKPLIAAVLQAGRNFRYTWGSQLMTLLTVTISVLIFSFFLLVYTNLMRAGSGLGGDLRLMVYLQEEPLPEMLTQLQKKIKQFSEVEQITYISRQEGFKRLELMLGEDRDVLAQVDPLFLPPALEVRPVKDLKGITQIELFSQYLARLPGVVKVQYGQGWIERFNQFARLLRVIVLVSAVLLILTTSYMVAYTVRLTVAARQEELKILRLLGATGSYIRLPFLLEGLMQGMVGSSLGLTALALLYHWLRSRFAVPGFFDLFAFTFFSPPAIGTIIAAGVLLCVGGSITSMRRFLRT